MPAEIRMTDTMFSHRQRPWHGMGTIVEEAPTSEDAIKLAGLDWSVERVPVIVDGRTLDDRVGLVRSTDRRFFNIVGNRYKILQNNVAFSILDSIIGDGIQYETAGSLFNGEKVFLTCAFEESISVAGDDIKTYLLLSNSHSGKESLHLAITPVRVVCNNTLQLALANSVSHWAIPHFSSMRTKIEAAQTTLRLTHEYMNQFKEYGERAADTVIGDGLLESMTEELWPKKKDMTLQQLFKRESSIRIFEHCLNAPDLRDIRGTAWGIINAVSDYETHASGKKRDRILESALSGTTPLLKKAVQFLQIA